MSKRRLSLIPGGALVGIVRASIERALGRPANGAFAERLTRELATSIRRAGSSVQSMTRSDVLSELEQANHELVRWRDRVRAELADLRRQEVLQREQLSQSHEELVRAVDGGAASRERLTLNQMRELFRVAQRDSSSFDVLQARIETLVLDAARSEREDLIRDLTAERDRQIDQLERRIAKLVHSLEQSESALRQMAARKDVEGGLESIYRTVQGLSADSPNVARKAMMLDEIFRANIELRNRSGLERTSSSTH